MHPHNRIIPNLKMQREGEASKGWASEQNDCHFGFQRPNSHASEPIG
jgi:hypothetical protein